MNQPAIFISCVSPEFRQIRSRVAAILARLGYTPVIQEIFGTEPGDLRQVLRDKIDACDGLIQIVGQGYGAEPPTVDANYGRVSYTQFEFLYARTQKKKTWLLFAGEACTRDMPLDRLDLPNDPAHPDPMGYQVERRALQLAYCDKRKRDGHLYHTATSDADLELKVERLRNELAELGRALKLWQNKVLRAFAVSFVLLALIGGSIWWFVYIQHREIHSISEKAGHITTLKGVILENELNGPPLEGVQIGAISGANYTTSNSSGEFTLEFPQRRPGDMVRIIVNKEGYVVVNDVQLRLALPADAGAAPLTVILAKEVDREEMVRRFYRLQTFDAIEETYRKKVRELEDVHRADATALANLQKERDQAKAAGEKAADQLAKESPSKIEDPAKSFPLARRDLLRTFMRWQVPNNGIELSQALAINIGALGVIYFLSVLALYGIAPARFVAWHEWIANRGIPFSVNISKILAPFLLDTPYSLNAVVRRYRQRALQLFDKAPEVETRPKWVPAPFVLGDELLQIYDPPPAKGPS
jgi:hypothetical protein